MSWSKKEIPTSQFCNVVNRGITLLGGKLSPNDVDAYLCFHLKLRASHLLINSPPKTAQHFQSIDAIETPHRLEV